MPEELQHLSLQNQFVTKTCLTTFTYLTSYLEDGTTKTETREKVVTNTATEERNLLRITPTATSGITLTQVSSHFSNKEIVFGIRNKNTIHI